MVTSAPSATRALAVPRPMPLPPPVMNACWPASGADVVGSFTRPSLAQANGTGQFDGPVMVDHDRGVTTAIRTSRRQPTPIWLLLVAGSIIASLSLGVRSTFGLFLDPVIETLETGRGSFALAIAVQNLFWGLSQPVAGAVADRFGRPGCSSSVRSPTPPVWR